MLTEQTGEIGRIETCSRGVTKFTTAGRGSGTHAEKQLCFCVVLQRILGSLDHDSFRCMIRRETSV